MCDQAVILLVEDLEDDVIMIRHALKNAHITNPVQVVRDGAAAIAYLRGDGDYGNRRTYPLPALMLLDLNMPRLDGFEVLRWLQDQQHLAKMRVVVLTDSMDTRDTKAAYQLGAHSFLVKPTDFSQSVRLMTQMANEWLPGPHIGEPPPENGTLPA